MLDALTETSIYVVEEDSHRLLYFNRRCEEIGRGRVVLGAKCHEIWPEICVQCPLHSMKSNSSSHIVCYDPLIKSNVDVTANRIKWDDHIRAVVITVTPHRLNSEEERELRKIEQMYTQSLVTVFDECIIANLTADFYINCQENALWAKIPEQKNFDSDNRKYAKKTLHPEDFELFIEVFTRKAMLRLFGNGKKQISRRLRRLDCKGAYRMAEFTAAKIEQFGEEEEWCVLVWRDIQDEYLLEQKRNVEISQLATAARFAYQMLIAVNLTQNTYHMLEYNRFPVEKPGQEGCFNDLIASELSTVHPEYQKEFKQKFLRKALMQFFSRGGRIVSMEVPHRGKDGVYHWHFTQVVRIESPYTDDLIEITLSRNIDKERHQQEQILKKEREAKQLLEEALQKAEKANRAKSDFLSKMSHDIRTPMNAIVGMTELAQMHIGEKERMKEYLKKIAGSGRHLLGLINEVLDVSKIESGILALEEIEFDLRDLVREAVELVRLSIENKQQVLTIHFQDELHVRVLGDARRLKQVLVNLLENASKYTDEKGNVFLTLSEMKNNKRTVGTYQFVIEDTGIGMKPEYLQHIFEPFSRADDSRISKVAGTGLGMTIVKNLISMMGGEIQVESEYKKGSRFFITLCLTKCAISNSDVPVKILQKKETFSGMRALLVEDNEINRQIATEMLEILGVQVETAEDGQQAVEAIFQHAPFYYNIVFMDVQMPVMNGYEATKTIRNSGIDRIDELPIIAITADVFTEDVKQARLVGMDGHLPKPISIEQLKAVLSQCLNKQNKLESIEKQ